MSFKDDGAIKRIFNTFKRLKTGIFQQDIDALKQLQSSLDYYKKQNVDNNKLYAVVLCLLLKERARRMDMNTAFYMVTQDIKSFTLNQQIILLTNQLNANELCRFMEHSKIDVPKDVHEPEELQKYIDQWHGKYDKELVQKIMDSWTEQEVSDSFYNTANELLKELEPIWNK